MKKRRQLPRGPVGRYVRGLKAGYRASKRVFILYSILRALVLLTLAYSVITRNFESAFACVLSLILFLLPAFVERKMKVEIPDMFLGVIFLFIFAAEIMGEANHYYARVPGWDTVLHTLNGFLCAAVGFSLVELLNDGSAKVKLSPIYLVLAAFCFSMTIGVVWEFFECSVDVLLKKDMQKDHIVKAFTSVMLDPRGMGGRVRAEDITRTVIETSAGELVVEGGYLDIGLMDTMKDLFVNFVGAVVYSVIGYVHLKRKDSSALMDRLTIRRAALTDGEEAAAGARAGGEAEADSARGQGTAV